MYSCDICGLDTDIGSIECCKNCLKDPEIKSQYEAKLRERCRNNINSEKKMAWERDESTNIQVQPLSELSEADKAARVHPTVSVTIAPEKHAKRDPVGLRYDLIPGDVLKEIAAVLHKGAVRYDDNNWQKSRLKGADGPINHALKHLNHYNAGIPDDDGDDPKIHLAHALCNIIFELYYELNITEYPK